MSLLFVLTIMLGASPPATEDPWEKAIRAFEEQDKRQPPPRDAVLFVGSSTIRMWDIERSFPGLRTINRGFGGSQFSDVALYVDRIILPYHACAMVIYSGDNDIAGGKTPETVFADFKELIKKIRQGAPETRVIVLAIKPSIARWNKYDKMQQVNRLMDDFAKRDPHMTFADFGKALLGPDDKPRADLFLKDGLHLNEQGYGLWTSMLKPMLGIERLRD